MTERKLLNAIGEVDERYVDELITFVQCSSEQKRKPKMLLLVAVIGTILFALTAGAVSMAMEEDVWFRNFFAAEEAVPPDAITEHQLELLDRGLVDVGQTVLQDGYTMTLVNALCDGHRLLAKIKVEAPNGVVLQEGRYDLILEYKALYPDGTRIPFGAMAGGCSKLEDADPTDGTIQFLLDVRMQPKPDADEAMLIGAKWEICVSELQYAYSREEEYWIDPLATGEWSFCIPFDDTSLLTREREILNDPIRLWAVCYWDDRPDRTFPINIRVTSLRLRALSATLSYDKPLTGFWHGIDIGDIYVVMKDDTKILAHWDMGHNKGTYWQDTLSFPVPVAVEDIAYVLLPGGQKICIGE